MLRLHRHRHQSKSGEKLDFKFSGFKAIQVPKGWDKLVVSFVSLGTGKTLAKTSRAVVRNGSCQWAETVSESIRVSEDDDPSKEAENCLFKLIVSMGSGRSGVLGEATLNAMDYASTIDCVPVSLSLKKCTHGTTLQVKVQCMTPRLNSRDENLKQKNSDLEKPNENHQDIDMKSDGSGSDSTAARSLRSSSTKDFRLNSNPGDLGSRETSFSLSESHQSYDSAEGSTVGEDMSVGVHGSDDQSLVRRADSLGSGHQSDNSGVEFPGSSSLNSNGNSNSNSNSSAMNFRDASEGTVEELHAEAKMWERNARKLMLDLDVLKSEFSDMSRIQENMSLELSEACAERDVLKKEVEQLTLLSANSLVTQTSSEDLTRDELRFQKESNADLAMQLKKSHESSIELVSVLQELEETVEKQKTEIEDLLALQSKSRKAEKLAEENVEENRKLKKQLQQFHYNLELGEQVLEDKNQQIEKERFLSSQNLIDIENDYKTRLLEKDEEIISLKAKLSETLNAASSDDLNLMREIEDLREKVQELERDCNELTEENLELLFKLKEGSSESARMSTSVEFPHRTSFEFQLREQHCPTDFAKESSEKRGLNETTNDGRVSVEEVQSSLVGLEVELAEMEKLQGDLRSKEGEISVLRMCKSELEAKVSDLQKEKAQIQEHMAVVLQESEITSKCLNDLQNDLAVLTSSVDSHSSSKKVLERKSSELETGNRELELQVTELERENVQLSVLVSSLEAQLKALASQLDSSRLELESSKSHSISLNNELNRLRQEMQSTVESFIIECDFLRKSNGELNNENVALSSSCSTLEAKLEEAQQSFLDCSKRVDEIEQYLSSVVAEFASKEGSLASAIDALVSENLRDKEKAMEKDVEAQKLQEEVDHLIKKLSDTHEENERMASDAIEEMSRLRADNAKLASDLGEIQFRLRLAENELKNKEIDSEVKLKTLSSKLVESNQEHEELFNLVENYKSSEAKYKTLVSDLELKLTVSEYQRQQLSEDSSYLNAELKRLAHLEHELSETKAEKEKLEAFMRAMSEECSDLKMEKNELIEKISTLTTKLVQMEDDLAEIDVLRVRDTELKKELGQIKNENKQYQLKIEQLQEERHDSQRQSQALDHELKLVKEEKQNLKEQHSIKKGSSFSKTNTKVNPVQETAKVMKNEMGKSLNQRRDNRRNQSQRENGGGGCESPDGSPRDRADLGTKIQLLEDQLAKALEENSKYRVQLNKFVSENRKVHSDVLRKSSTMESEVVSKAKFERTKSILETELRDIRERYSSMSLKYAEVEAQREELVMKLKSSSTRTSSKKWFS